MQQEIDQQFDYDREGRGSTSSQETHERSDEDGVEVIFISQLTLETLRKLAALIYQRDPSTISDDDLDAVFLDYEHFYKLPEILEKAPFRFAEAQREGADIYTAIEALRVKVKSLLYGTDRWNVQKIRDQAQD